MLLVSRRWFHGGLVAAAAVLLGAGLLGAAPAGAAIAPGVRAVLLPVPRAAAGTALSTSVVAVTPLGAMAGTTSSLRTLPDGSSAGDSNAERWLPAGPAPVDLTAIGTTTRPGRPGCARRPSAGAGL